MKPACLRETSIQALAFDIDEFHTIRFLTAIWVISAKHEVIEIIYATTTFG